MATRWLSPFSGVARACAHAYMIFTTVWKRDTVSQGALLLLTKFMYSILIRSIQSLECREYGPFLNNHAYRRNDASRNSRFSTGVSNVSAPLRCSLESDSFQSRDFFEKTEITCSRKRAFSIPKSTAFGEVHIR